MLDPWRNPSFYERRKKKTEPSMLIDSHALIHMRARVSLSLSPSSVITCTRSFRNIIVDHMVQGRAFCWKCRALKDEAAPLSLMRFHRLEF